MKLYLDTADASQWQLPAGCPAVQGITTNPTLILKAVQALGKIGRPAVPPLLEALRSRQAQRARPMIIAR